jgi:hypothetical protein
MNSGRGEGYFYTAVIESAAEQHNDVMFEDLVDNLKFL